MHFNFLHTEPVKDFLTESGSMSFNKIYKNTVLFLLCWTALVLGRSTLLHRQQDLLASDMDQVLMEAPQKRLSQVSKKDLLEFMKKRMVHQKVSELKDLSHLIHNLALKYQWNPKFIVALIMIESRFNNWAVSPKGAMGLMQIMPETGEWLAGRLGVAWEGPLMLFDPSINLRFGIAYLEILRAKYGNNMKAVLSAYNAGPAFFDKAQLSGKGYQHHYYRSVKSVLLSDMRF